MRKFVLRIFFASLNLFITNSVFSQPSWQKLWDYRYGGTDYEGIRNLLQTTDSGFLMGGFSQSGINGNKSAGAWGLYDYWLVKTDSSGIKQWDKHYGGSDYDEFGAMEQTTDGGFILGGASSSGIGGDKTEASWGGWDFWIVKTDAAGDMQWNKRYGGYSNEEFAALQQTNDGGYIIGGSTYSGITGDITQSPYGYTDYWIIKINAAGIVQWDKRYGGNDYDEMTTIEQTSDGGYILGGYSSSPPSGNKTATLTGLDDYWIIKTDALGNKLWEKNYGGNLSNKLTVIHQTPDGGYIIGGESNSGATGDKSQPSWGYYDMWIIKTDSLGNMQWNKDFGGDQNDEVNFITLTPDSGYLLSGDSYSSITGDKSESNLGFEQTWVIKIDSNGTKFWDKTIFTNGHDEVGKAIVATDGCYVIANMTNSGIGGYKTEANWDTSNVTYDYWMVKFRDTTVNGFAPVINLASSDTFFCEKQCIDFYDLSTNNPTSWQWFFPGADSVTSTLQNPANICYQVYGSFDVTLIACNNAGCDTLTYSGFINEYQNPVDSVWISNDTLYSLPFPTYQWYETNAGLITGATNQYFVPSQPGSYYCIVGDTIGCISTSNIVVYTALDQLSIINNQLSIQPNPNDGKFEIMFDSNSIFWRQGVAFQIVDVFGRLVFQNELQISSPSTKIKVDVSFLSDGIYFLEISSPNQNNGEWLFKKFVKQ